MFGRKQTTALEYKPVPVTDMADLQPGDLCMFTANGGRVATVVLVHGIMRDGKPLFERMDGYDKLFDDFRGDSFYVFTPGETWRFVGAFRTA